MGILPAHFLMGAFFTATSMIDFIAAAISESEREAPDDNFGRKGSICRMYREEIDLATSRSQSVSRIGIEQESAYHPR